MRILMVHNDYGIPSGEEHAAEALASLLAEQGHRVFWVRRSSVEIGNRLGDKMKAFFSGIHSRSAARALADALDEVRPDIVQVQNIYPLLSPSIFGPIRARGLPIVMRCPNYRLFCPNGRHWVRGDVCEKCLSAGRELWCVLRNCEDSLTKSVGYALRNAWARTSGSILRNVDAFIVQSDFQKNKFIERGVPRSHIVVVPGLVGCNGMAGPQLPGDLVTFVGRVSSDKGIDDFLGAARRMPKIPFAVAGSTQAMPGIEGKATENVAWLGFLRSEALYDLYGRSRIVVVPSRWYEGFPNVLAQAMMYGRPVVTARIGALASIIDDGTTGLLFEPCDDRGLAETIRLLYDDPQRCRTLGENGRRKMMESCSPGAVYQRLTEVYEVARANCSVRRRSSSAARRALFKSHKSSEVLLSRTDHEEQTRI